MFRRKWGSEWWCLLGAVCLTAALLATRGRPGTYSAPGLLLLTMGGVCCVLGVRSPESVPARHPLPGPGVKLQVLFWAMVMVHLALAVAVIRSTPGEVNDVYLFQRDAARALLQGVNPYTITHLDRDVAHSWFFYGPGVSEHGRLQFGFPYLPASLLLVLPGYLAGDVRYALTAALAACALLMWQMRKDGFSLMAMGVLLLNPVTFFVISQSWTEPLLVLLVCWAVLAACKRSRWLAVAVGILLASKQYAVLGLPLMVYLVPAPGIRRAMRLSLRALAIMLLLTAPFAVWNFPRFWHDVMVLQTVQPFRADSLSFSALSARLGAGPIPQAVVGGASLAALIWSLLAARARRPGVFASSFGFVLLPFFALNKQAFCNYYFLVMGCMLTAAVAARAGPEGTARSMEGVADEGKLAASRPS